jgi:hypothetical protein
MHQRHLEASRRYRQNKRLRAAEPVVSVPLVKPTPSTTKVKASQLLPNSFRDPQKWQSMTKAEYDLINGNRPVTGTGFIGQFKHTFHAA